MAARDQAEATPATAGAGNRGQVGSANTNEARAANAGDARAGDAGAVPAAEAGDARAHEDLAQFRRAEQYLAELLAEAERRRDAQGAYARRFARLAIALEDALLQARQGGHEAHYAQGAHEAHYAQASGGSGTW